MATAPARDDSAERDATGLSRKRGLAARRAESTLVMLRQRTENLTQPRVVDRILQAATRAVADCGLDGLSMENVALRAGCSRATVYRRVGGKDALRDAVLDEATIRIFAAVAMSVAGLEGNERLVRLIVVALETIRADPVSAALLTGPAAGRSVSSATINHLLDDVASLTSLADGIRCELLIRVTLALLSWPGADTDAELAIVRQFVYGPWEGP